MDRKAEEILAENQFGFGKSIERKNHIPAENDNKKKQK